MTITIRNRRFLRWIGYSGKCPVKQTAARWLREIWWRLTGT